jgi:amphi-Trp domain-containing protein
MYSAQLGRRTGGPLGGTEKAVADVKVQQKQALSRQEAARFIAALAQGLGDDGTVTVQLGSSTLELSVAGQLDCELEVAVDCEEIELELELKWSTSGHHSVEATQDKSGTDDLEEDDSDEGASEDHSEEDEGQPDDAVETPADEDVAEQATPQDGASIEEAAGSSAAESVPEQPAQPRRGRRKTAAPTGKAAFNGVDTAAVRAWAAANGFTVSPRGRIREEVIEAYRAAGN